MLLRVQNSVNYIACIKRSQSTKDRKPKNKTKQNKKSEKSKQKTKIKQVPRINKNYSFCQPVADRQSKHSKKIEISAKPRQLSI